MKSLSFDSRSNYYVIPVMRQSALGSVIRGHVTSYVSEVNFVVSTHDVETD